MNDIPRNGPLASASRTETLRKEMPRAKSPNNGSREGKLTSRATYDALAPQVGDATSSAKRYTQMPQSRAPKHERYEPNGHERCGPPHAVQAGARHTACRERKRRREALTMEASKSLETSEAAEVPDLANKLAVIWDPCSFVASRAGRATRAHVSASPRLI